MLETNLSADARIYTITVHFQYSTIPKLSNMDVLSPNSKSHVAYGTSAISATYCECDVHIFSLP